MIKTATNEVVAFRQRKKADGRVRLLLSFSPEWPEMSYGDTVPVGRVLNPAVHGNRSC